MKQITQFFPQRVLFVFILLVTAVSTTAQVFNNGQGPVFSEITSGVTCASDSFNTFLVDFFFNEDQINSSNEFVIELSDPNGDFSNPIEVSTPQSFTSSPVEDIPFSLPEDAAGENYRIRIKSSDPVAISSPSMEFAAYFITHNIPFSINNVPDTITSVSYTHLTLPTKA